MALKLLIGTKDFISEKIYHIGNLFYICKQKAVRVIAKSTLRNFWIMHKDCENALISWCDEAVKSSWASPNEIKFNFPSVSILKDNRLVFNVKGNSYRLIVRINYKFGIVWIRFIGTHAEYDKINAETI